PQTSLEAQSNCIDGTEKKQSDDRPLDNCDHAAIRRSAGSRFVHGLEDHEGLVIREVRKTLLRDFKRILTGINKLAAASVKAIKPVSNPRPNESKDRRRSRMLFGDGRVCCN